MGTMYQGPGTTYGQGAAPAPAPQKPAGPSPAVKAGASWFTTISVLSVVNTLLLMFQAPIFFPVGLGVTEIFAAFGLVGGSAAKTVAFVLTVVVAAIFFGISKAAARGNKTVFIIGMVLYIVDTLIYCGIALLPGMGMHSVLSIGFHIYGLIRIYNGVKEA